MEYRKPWLPVFQEASTGWPFDQGVKTRFQHGPLGLVRLLAIRLQVFVKLPDLVTDFLDFGAVLVVVRYQLGQRSVGVDPTGTVYEHDELRGSIADYP